MFVFNLGDGQDAITADDIEGTDTLSFGAGIALADLRLEKSGNYDLTVQVGANGDQVTLSNWFYPGREGRRVDRFAFADGTVLSRQELLEQKAVNGTAGAEDLSGNDEIKDILAGGGGNDGGPEAALIASAKASATAGLERVSTLAPSWEASASACSTSAERCPLLSMCTTSQGSCRRWAKRWP